MSGNNIETIMRKYLLFFMLLVSICAHAQQRQISYIDNDGRWYHVYGWEEDYDTFQTQCWGTRGMECRDYRHQVWRVV